MGILSDHQIQNLIKNSEIIIDPYFSVFQGPNCYHCHLGNNFKRIKKELINEDISVNPLEESAKNIYESFTVEDHYVMKPGEFLLAETFEYLGTSTDYVIKLLNSSSLARVGISQAAVGMINAGNGIKKPFKLTLELINNSPTHVKLIPTKVEKNGHIIWGTEVLKISVMRMDERPSVSYDDWKFGVYSGDNLVSGTKMANRFNDKDLFVPKKSLYTAKK